MTLVYNLDKQLKDLAAVVEDYTEWFMHVLRHISYPENNGKEKLTRPDSFTTWASEALEENIQPELIGRLNILYAEFSKLAEKVIADTANSKKPPEFKDYNKVVTFFEEFINLVRRLEKDLVLEDSGIDSLTGLRSSNRIEKDIRRELDRLARQGKPFSLALVRIDSLEKMKSADKPDCIKKVAEMIKKSVRSFDDAYRLESDEFVLSLKQADMNGGIRALERLKKELEHADAHCKIDGQDVPVTLSSCIAVPDPGDNVKELLANLKQDLDESAKSEGTVLQYFEMSPLQRFVKEGQR